MSFVLDIIVVLIIALFVFLSARRGFVRTLIEVVGFVLAAVLAFSLSAPITTAICENGIKPIIEEATLSALDDAPFEDVAETTEGIWDELPDFVVNVAEAAGITKGTVKESISNTASQTAHGVATHITDNIFIPIVSNIIKTIVTFLLFLAFIVLVMFLARIINKLFSGFILGKFNRILGGALGAIKGAVIAAIFCLLFSIIVKLSPNGVLSITTETLDSTYIFSRILDIFSL